MKVDRLHYLDRVKGFAILLVVLGHFYLFVLHADDSLVSKFIGSFHMNLFMFVSGYVAFIGDIGIRPILKKVSKRCVSYVVPMYIFGWILYLFGEYICEGVNPMTQFVKSTVLLGNWYWYLKCLCVFQLLTFLMHTKKSILFELFIAVALYTIFFAGWKLFPAASHIFCLEHATCFFPYYILGLLMRKYPASFILFRSEAISMLSLAFYILLFFITSDNYFINNILHRFILPTLAIIVTLFFFSKTESCTSPAFIAFEKLGKNSLCIYIFHYFFIAALNLSFIWSWGKATFNYFLILVLAVCASFIISILSMFIGDVLNQNALVSKLLFGKIK